MGITVEGVFISDEQLDSVGMHMATCISFTYTEVQSAFARASVPPQQCYRAADRWLQMAKKGGKIKYSGGAWRWLS